MIRGDLTPEQFRGLAQVMRDYSGGYARTTVGQNLVLRWVRDETVYEVWRALSELGLGDAGAQEINDVVSCPGTDSCKLGITCSMGLNSAVRERIEAMDITDPLTRRVHIKMSGCPNGCSQHHIANIGFYGASIKVGEHTVPGLRGPHRRPLRGRRGGLRHAAEGPPGRQAGARGGGALAAPVRVRARPRARSSTPSPSASGTIRFEDEVRDLAMPIEFSLENMSHFVDWQRKEPFQVIRGEGECAI